MGVLHDFRIICVAEQMAALGAARINRPNVLAALHFPNGGDLSVLFNRMIRDFVLVHLGRRFGGRRTVMFSNVLSVGIFTAIS